MLGLFTRSMKWFFFVLCLILAFRCVTYVQHFGMTWSMPALLCLGGMFILSNVWRDLPPRAVIISVWLIIMFAGLGHVIDNIIYLLSNVRIVLGFFTGWTLVSLFLGVPIMMAVFNKYK